MTADAKMTADAQVCAAVPLSRVVCVSMDVLSLNHFFLNSCSLCPPPLLHPLPLFDITFQFYFIIPFRAPFFCLYVLC